MKNKIQMKCKKKKIKKTLWFVSPPRCIAFCQSINQSWYSMSAAFPITARLRILCSRIIMRYLVFRLIDSTNDRLHCLSFHYSTQYQLSVLVTSELHRSTPDVVSRTTTVTTIRTCWRRRETQCLKMQIVLFIAPPTDDHRQYCWANLLPTMMSFASSLLLLSLTFIMMDTNMNNTSAVVNARLTQLTWYCWIRWANTTWLGPGDIVIVEVNNLITAQQRDKTSVVGWHWTLDTII